MEKELKCTLLLSLKEMCLRTVVAVSLSSSNVFASASQVRGLFHSTNENRKERRECVEVVKDKLLQLIPNKLTKQAKDLFNPIDLELRKWILSHGDLMNPSEDKCLPGLIKLYWTSLGVIDDQKTAKNLVHSDIISLERRYKIACCYCLEDSIPLLWKELPEQTKVYYSNRNGGFHHLAFAWPHLLSSEPSKLDYLLRKGDRILTSFNQWGFEYSAEIYNKTATKYFFEKLTFAEREDSLIRSTHALLANITERSFIDHKVPVLCYLLALMTVEERKETVKKHPLSVFILFLYWPLPCLFFENMSLVWTFLPPADYGPLLVKLSDRFHMLNHYFPKWFSEFFIQSPPELKNYFANNQIKYLHTTAATDFLSLFMKAEDPESIQVIFQNVDETDRVKIVFDQNVKNLFWESMVHGRWHMVEVCLKEATLSEENKKRWMEDFLEVRGIDMEDEMWNGFCEFFNLTPKERRGKKRKRLEVLDGGFL